MDLEKEGQVADNGPVAASVSAPALARLLGDRWNRRGTTAAGLAAGLRALVVDGRLAPRTRVPSERTLAPALGVSRGTVTRAYDRLRRDGFLVSDRGAGSRLSLPGASVPPLPPPAAGRPRLLDLSVAALPAPEPLLAEAVAAAAEAFGRHAASHGYASAGLAELRERVAHRFGERGLPTTGDQIVITAGAQHALHLVLALLAAPGDRILVDAPAYPRTLSAIRGRRGRAVAVPLAAEGWDVEAWEWTLAAAAPRLAVTGPDFQNPTGLSMGEPERAALAERCARAGTVLVADETTAELWLDGPTGGPPLASHGPRDGVLTIGSLSKAGWGGLRLGWIRAAPRVARELAAVRADLDMASPVLEQLVAIELLDRLGDLLASRRALLVARRTALLEALAAHAPSWTTRPPAGGLSAWVRLPAPVATRLAAAAAREGVLVAPGPSFSVDGTFEHHLRLPFTAPPDDLETAVRRLAAIAPRLGPHAPEPSEAALGAV